MSAVQLLFCDAGTVTHRHFLKLDFYLRKFCFCHFKTLLSNSQLTKNNASEIRKLLLFIKVRICLFILTVNEKDRLENE